MKLPMTFLDRLLARDPLAGLMADLGRALNARDSDTGGLALGDLDTADSAERKRLARRVARVIRTHDPRFGRVEVRASADCDDVRLHITLYLPAPEPVRVDAVRSTRRWSVTKPEGKR